MARRPGSTSTWRVRSAGSSPGLHRAGPPLGGAGRRLDEREGRRGCSRWIAYERVALRCRGRLFSAPTTGTPARFIAAKRRVAGLPPRRRRAVRPKVRPRRRREARMRPFSSCSSPRMRKPQPFASPGGARGGAESEHGRHRVRGRRHVLDLAQRSERTAGCCFNSAAVPYLESRFFGEGRSGIAVRKKGQELRRRSTGRSPGS